MADAGTQLKETEQPAALGADDAALLSADDFAAALAEIENAGPLSAKPQAPPKPGRNLGGVDAGEASGEVEAESPQREPVPPTPEPVTTPAEPISNAAPAVEASPTSTVTAGEIPVEAPVAPLTPESSAAAESLATPAPPPVSPPPATVPTAPGLKFKIGKKGAEAPSTSSGSRAAAAEPVSTPAAAASALDLPTMSPTVRLGKRFIRWAEGVLDAVHRPLERISPKLLPMLGVCALTTIGVSATSIIALPILFPSRDAISFLDERVAALDAPKPIEKPKEDSAGHGSEKSKKDAGSGHGEAKPTKKDEGDGHGEAKPKKKAGGDGHGAAAAKPAAATKSGGAKKSSAAH